MSRLPDLHSLPGPEDILRVELPNGIVLLSRANFNSPSVYLEGYLPAGGLFDPDEQLGLADFTASVMMRGTEQHSFQEIYDLLESAGASLSVNGGTHTASFRGKALSEDLDLVLGLLAEILRQPTFPVEHVEKRRAQLLTALAIRAQDTGEMAALAFDQIVYRDHPYSRPEDGYPETIQAIQAGDMAGFHRQHYGPKGMTLVITGGVEPLQAIEKAARAFTDWQNPRQTPAPQLPALAPLDQTLIKRIALPGKSQADLVIGVAGPRRADPDYLAASLGNNILGQFGMMGRIGERVREEAGLAYYAASSLGGGLGPGPWDVSAGVAPENVDQAIALIIEELQLFCSELVARQELEDSQAHYIGRLPVSLESNAGVAGALINIERHSLGLDYYRRYAGMVQAVTREQILSVAQRFLDPQRLGIAIAGP